jgi:peptidoglycan hydrolase CwlO-like protein
MEAVALAIIGLAVLLVFSLGSKGSASRDAPAALPSAKIYDIYSDLIAPNKGDSDNIKDKKDKLRLKLGELEAELKSLENLRAAWENGRQNKVDVFDTFKRRGETVAKTAGEAKALLAALKDTLKG